MMICNESKVNLLQIIYSHYSCSNSHSPQKVCVGDYGPQRGEQRGEERTEHTQPCKAITIHHNKSVPYETPIV